MKPLIGITAGIRSEEFSRATSQRVDISLFYSNAVTAAGGIPVILAPIPGTESDLLDRLDGFVFSGGSDLDPKLFGDDTVHPETYGIDPARDAFELALARLAYDRDAPVLGICRGIQSLNVALGGTLHQHVPELSATSHRQQELDVPAFEPSHTVTFAEQSILAEIYDSTTVQANSFHHQAVDRLPEQFVASGWTQDGLIEAIEAPGRQCFFAVQWHPEMMFGHHDEQIAPFRHLIDIARSRQLVPSV